MSIQHSLNNAQKSYEAAASEFKALQDQLIAGKLTGHRLIRAEQLWVLMERNNQAARLVGTAVTFEGQTHLDQFDDVRGSILNALRKPAFEDVIELADHGTAHDAGAADDWDDNIA